MRLNEVFFADSRKPLTTKGLGRPAPPKSLMVRGLQNFYPPITFALSHYRVPTILALLIGESPRGMLIYKLIHLALPLDEKQTKMSRYSCLVSLS